MAVVVIGGHTRNIGKTSTVTGLIASLPERRWTAIKITQFGHGICSADGKPCGCATDDHSFAITDDRRSTGETDTSRYLVAGAARAVWVRTRQGRLFEAMPKIREIIAAAPNVVIESNSVLQFLRPDVFLSVLDTRIADFKGSARRFLDRADAVLLNSTEEAAAGWYGDLQGVLSRLRLVPLTPPDYFSEEARSIVEQGIAGR